MTRSGCRPWRWTKRRSARSDPSWAARAAAGRVVPDVRWPSSAVKHGVFSTGRRYAMEYGTTERSSRRRPRGTRTGEVDHGGREPDRRAGSLAGPGLAAAPQSLLRCLRHAATPGPGLV